MKTGSTDKLFLVLRQQKERYAVPAENVEEVITSPGVTAMPLQPDYFRGIFNYKGHILPVLSLQVLSGCRTDAPEGICAVLRLEDDTMFALAAESAESLIPDTGERMQCGENLTNGKRLVLAFVLPDDPAVFVLDLERTYEAAGKEMN